MYFTNRGFDFKYIIFLYQTHFLSNLSILFQKIKVQLKLKQKKAFNRFYE